MTESRTYILAGGGTGGHLYPALAIAEMIKRNQPDCDIHFIGTARGVETRVVPKQGYPLHLIAVRGVARNRFWMNVSVPFRLLCSLVQSRNLLKQLNPVIVIGTGGYVSGPILYMAQAMNIPTLIQEQNSYPGITTRLLAKRADRVHLSFESSLNWLKRHDNCRITGNPVRRPAELSKQQARRAFGLHSDKLTVLIFGGSQGAHAVNQAVLEIIDPLIADEIQLIWGTGEADESMIRSSVSDKPVWLNAFIDDMPAAYRAADLAVTRAGAMTLAELAVNQIPSLLIPYPYAAADHQLNNAKALVEKGAAVVIEQKDLHSGLLLKNIKALLQDDQKRAAMAQRAGEMAFPDAAKDLYGSIQEVSKS
ncbi:MAG: undecaprenyldiphospho-muramoylpentapeptide beta-N-acetylglucosaminyltransferase [candidate division KSB1 bacterium]|nr:undecaprenyldiphospho-muramoylpentapeptide beta-N-acetylglucosaminyltransferase [candidate division KSB1 bacterium]